MTFEPVSFLIGLAVGGAGMGLASLLWRRQSDAALEHIKRSVIEAGLQASLSTNQNLLALAEQQFGKFHEVAKSDLDRRGLAIDNTVTPIKETLAKLNERLQQTEQERATAGGALNRQLTDLAGTQDTLRGETAKLVQALRAPTGRGLWGEMQLDRLLDKAGMTEGIHFDRQVRVQAANDDGSDSIRKPDIVIRLTEGKSIVVDAKTPMQAYLDALAIENEDQRAAKLKSHAQDLRKQMKELAKRDYWKQFKPSPEFVVMFVPYESALTTALQCDVTLLEAAMDENIIITTPLTLFALLQCIAYDRRQESFAKNATAISELGRELYERVSKMADNLRQLGKCIGNVTSGYNTAIGQIESRLLVTARKLKSEHDIGPEEMIAPLEALDGTPRALSAPEFQITVEE